MASPSPTDLIHTRNTLDHVTLTAGRCRFTVSKYVLKAPVVPGLETKTACN